MEITNETLKQSCSDFLKDYDGSHGLELSRIEVELVLEALTYKKYQDMWEELETKIDGAVELGISLGYNDEYAEDEMRAQFEVYSRIQNMMMEIFFNNFKSN